MISRGPVYIIYAKTDPTVKNREYAFVKTFESVFDEDTFFNSCLPLALVFLTWNVPEQRTSVRDHFRMKSAFVGDLNILILFMNNVRNIFVFGFIH